MKLLYRAAALLLVLLCVCCTAAAAESRLTLVFIGGDADIEAGENNTFRNILLHHEDLPAEAFFVKSTMRDYTNATAKIHTGEAQACLSSDGINVVAGYSHGGQSVFFMDTAGISDIFLFDACVSIGGKCSNPTSNGKVWAEWIVDTAKKGISLHVFASRGKHNEPSGAKNAIANLKKVPGKDPCVIPLEDGQYEITDDSGNRIALIETAILEGTTHKDICIHAEDRVAQCLYALSGVSGLSR